MTWFDRAGNFHSDQMKVVERFTRTDRDHIDYEATVTDPKVFTRSWKIQMPLYRRTEPKAQILDYHCYAFEETTPDITVPLFRESPLK
jgi:aspartyl-tRNA synthetase